MGWKSKYKGSEVDFLLDNVEMENVTYSQLKAARTQNNLFPGKCYRITDYKTIITSSFASVDSECQFDIIVFALTKNTLSEIARAVPHYGNTHFQYSDVEGWELRYCLDNDSTRFNWANPSNGKGVIYWMKDEWGNEAYYDFKSIKFNYNGTNYYTFSIVDGSSTIVEASNSHGDSSVVVICANNIICAHTEYDGVYHRLSLEMNILTADRQQGYCNDNYIGPNCSNNFLGLNPSGNHLDGKNSFIVLARDSNYNYFGRGCHHITLVGGQNDTNRFYGSNNIVVDGTGCVFENCKNVSFVGGQQLTPIGVENSKFFGVNVVISNRDATKLKCVLVYGNVTDAIYTGTNTSYKEYGIDRGV